jgi:hypothetical protein
MTIALKLGMGKHLAVMAGHSRSKNGVASLAYAGHPRLEICNIRKT